MQKCGLLSCWAVWGRTSRDSPLTPTAEQISLVCYGMKRDSKVWPRVVLHLSPVPHSHAQKVTTTYGFFSLQLSQTNFHFPPLSCQCRAFGSYTSFESLQKSPNHLPRLQNGLYKIVIVLQPLFIPSLYFKSDQRTTLPKD